MTKKILIYIAGVVTGAVLVIFVAFLFAGNNSVDNITLFEQEGECVSDNTFEVFQVLDTGDALANEIDPEISMSTGLTVLFLGNSHTSYYDDQVIKIPSGKCAKQIGVFKYKSNAGFEKTVPIVEIHNK